MDRLRLTVLAICALLTTTIDPFSSSSDAQPLSGAAEAIVSNAGSPPVSAGPNSEVILASTHAHSKIEVMAERDATEVAAILRRLSIRHTALPEHERIALAYSIVREARAQDLEPSLVVSVIEVESAGYHLAVSHVGALGLMQLLPATGKELAEKHDVEWHGPDTLFNPEVNVKLGTAYLRQLTDQFGSVSTALAAYNWGPGRIKRRIRRGATVPSLYIEQVRAAQNRNITLASNRS